MNFPNEDERATYWLTQAKLIRGHARTMPLTIGEEVYWKRELTPTAIFMEQNISVRVAKIYCYGVEKFLHDGRCQVLDSEAGYELIALQMPDWDRMIALKMVCPSTKTVYIIPVPPYFQKVPAALDWYFDLPHYLERVAAQA